MKRRNFESFELEIQNIPVKVYKPINYNEETKTVIHYHGWTSDVTKYYTLGKLYAKQGIQFILPEIANHGVRKKDTNEEEHMIFIDSVLSTIDEFDPIVNHLKDNKMINPDKLIVSGHSMGGFITNILVGLRDFKAGIIYNGAGDVIDIVKDFYTLEALNGLTGEDKVKSDRLLSLNPIANCNLYNRKTIFAMIGEKDDVVNPNNMVRFLEELNNQDIDTSNIEYKFFAEDSHSISNDMIRAALDYTLNI